jgi:hypothetical protein
VLANSWVGQNSGSFELYLEKDSEIRRLEGLKRKKHERIERRKLENSELKFRIITERSSLERPPYPLERTVR